MRKLIQTFKPCKNVFYFLTFLKIFCRRFYLEKRSLKIPSRTSSSTFETTENNRSRFCYESGWVQSILFTLQSVLGNAYSDTAAVTSCSRRSQYAKSRITTNWIQFSPSLSSSAILHLQHWDNRQEVEQMITFLLNAFKRFYFSTVYVFWRFCFSGTFLPRDALLCKERYCDRMSSVCLSVTLVDCDHLGWNSSKIISPLVSLGCSLFATPTWRVCSKGNIGPKVAPRSMTLDDLELHKFEFSVNFSGFRRFRTQQQLNAWR